MDSAVIYESVLSNVQADLLEYGYARSGKSALFYRYSADKKVGCCIEMQKSTFNFPDNYSFTFNLLCVGLYELDEYYNHKLTVSALKACLHNPFISERIGIICRDRDYWWEITDAVSDKRDLEVYYTRFIQNDIKASASYLDKLAEKKQMKYIQNAASAD